MSPPQKSISLKRKDKKLITRATYKNSIDILEFINRVKDNFQDMYITENNARLFLTDLQLIKKILKTQEVFYYENSGEIKGLLIILKEKKFRTYLKILTTDYNATNALMKFFVWNRNEIDIFCKLKATNPIANVIRKFGFFVKGNRGKELLLEKKGFKTLNKIIPKDEYLTDETNRLY